MFIRVEHIGGDPFKLLLSGFLWVVIGSQQRSFLFLTDYPESGGLTLSETPITDLLTSSDIFTNQSWIDNHNYLQLVLECFHPNFWVNTTQASHLFMPEFSFVAPIHARYLACRTYSCHKICRTYACGPPIHAKNLD